MCRVQDASKTSPTQTTQQANIQRKKTKKKSWVPLDQLKIRSNQRKQKHTSRSLQLKLPYKPKMSNNLYNPYSKSRLKSKNHPTNQSTILPVQTHIDENWNSDYQWIGDQICDLETYAARFWVQNTNGIDISSNFSKFMETIDYMGRYHVQFLTIPETKLNPLNHYIRDNLDSAYQWIYPEGHYNLSNTPIDPAEIRQYGGVYSSTQGSLSQRFAGSGQDKIGRFNWMDFYGKKAYLRVYSIYRVNNGSDNTSGDETAWMDQRVQLLEQNINMNPRQHCIQSLCDRIKDDIKQSRSVIVCGDFNDNIFSPNINQKFESVGLKNIFSSRQQIFEATRSCSTGSTIIDGVWMSLDIQDNLIRSGFAPFDFIFSSDHRGIYFDIDMRQLLDHKNHNLLPSPYRRLKSRIPVRVNKYSDVVFDMWNKQNITDRIEMIEEHFRHQAHTPALIHQLNAIDNDIQSILSKGEKGCCSVNRHCVDNWSPQLKSSLRSLRQLKGMIRKQKKLNSNHDLLKQYLHQYRLAKIQLRESKKNDVNLREALLDQLAEDLLKDPTTNTRKKASVIKQIKNCERMKRDANRIKRAIKGIQNKGLTYVLIPALSAYSQEERNTSNFDHYSIKVIWKRLQVQNGKDVKEWERIENREKMETYVLQILQLHFTQASNTPLANIFWMEKLLEKPFQQRILNGESIDFMELPSATVEILKSFATTEKVNDIDYLPTFEQFKSFIKKSKEKTSASPSSRHYGHYKSLLKKIPHVLADIFKLLRLSLKYGIILDRWKKTITTLLCKDDNIPYIHRLRPIHIVEVELQFISKIIWSKHLIQKAESQHKIIQSQYGGRKNIQAQSSVLNTVLLYDYHRHMRLNFTYNDDDLRANYDRELAHFSALETRKYGLPYEAGSFMAKFTRNQQYYIKSKHGTSNSFYSFTKEVPIWGLGQGICWAGACWQFTATTIGMLLNKRAKGATITDPTCNILLTRLIEFFIDDTKKVCNQATDGKTLIEQARFNMQLHTNLVLSTGGSLALDKCKFYLIEFDHDKNGNYYIKDIIDSPGSMEIHNDFSEETVTIKRLEATVAHRTLGYYVSPNGDNSTLLQFLLDLTMEWVNRVKQSTLQGFQIIQSYTSILRPQLEYRMVASSLTYKDCDKINVLINPVLLHAYGMHEHFPRAILEADDTYAGLKLLHSYDLHGMQKLKFLRFHLQKMDYTGKLIFIQLQHIQLQLGIKESFLNVSYDIYSDFIEDSWLKHMWKYVYDRDVRLDLKMPITQSLQREGDEFLMDILRPHYPKHHLLIINKMRIHMRLLFLSDVVDINGTKVLPQLHNRLTYRTSTLAWPRQCWIRSWTSLWENVCHILNQHLSNRKLGTWRIFHNKWKAFVTNDNNYLQYDMTTYRLQKSHTRSVSYTRTNKILHNLKFINPCDIVENNKTISLISTMSMTNDWSRAIIPYKIDLQQEYLLFGKFQRDNEDDIVQVIKSNKAKMSCDGSVVENKGSFAYGIAGTGSNLLFLQHSPVHGDVDITSTKAELMGILACLKYLHYLQQKHKIYTNNRIIISADNQEAISASKKPLNSISCAYIAEGEIILEIQYWVKVLPFSLQFVHVRGHQDKKDEFSTLSPLAQMNIQMDTHAKKYFTTPTNSPTWQQISPFLLHSTISFRSRYTRITNNFYSNVLQQYTGSRAEDQMQQKLNLTDKTMQLIDWENLKYFFRTKKGYERYKLLKCVHRQWPVMKRNFDWGESKSPTCVLCNVETESCDHVLQCTSEHTTTVAREELREFHATLVELQTRPILIKHILRILRQWLRKFPVPKINLEHVRRCELDVAEAINDQISIGVDNFLRGILCWKLGVAQANFYASIPKKLNGDGKMWTRKVTGLVLTITMKLWKTRCHVVNTTLQMSQEQRIRQECMSMHIELQDKKNEISPMYRYLLERNKEYFQRARPSALKSWVRRVKLALQALNGTKSDIRHWFPVETVHELEIDDSTVDSDDTRNWVRMYPDEDPKLNTWITCTEEQNNFKKSFEEYVSTPNIPWQRQTKDIFN